MKILFISSGYKGIYPYFEQAIENAFTLSGHMIRKIKPQYDQEIMASVYDYKPDLIITLVGFMMDQTLMERLKKIGSKLCVWLTEDPFYMDKTMEIVKDYQYVFTVDLGAFTFYMEKFPDKSIFHLPLGTDPCLYNPSITPVQYSYDVCIVGYPYPERVELANEVLNQTPYSLTLVGPRWKHHVKNQYKENLTIINRWVSPEVVRNAFITSKIILNPHRAFDYEKNNNRLRIESKSINNRTFDIASCGGFQLISNQPDLNSHFLAEEIVSYTDYTHCLEMIDWYINRESDRKQYSKNAYERVLNSHTFFHRIQKILEQTN